MFMFLAHVSPSPGSTLFSFRRTSNIRPFAKSGCSILLVGSLYIWSGVMSPAFIASSIGRASLAFILLRACISRTSSPSPSSFATSLLACCIFFTYGVLLSGTSFSSSALKFCRAW